MHGIIEAVGLQALYDHWGFNSRSVSAVMALAFTFYISYTKIVQARTLFRKESGESFSTLFAVAFAYVYTAAFIYGLSIQDLPLVAQGFLRGGTMIPIMIGLMYKGYTKQDLSLAAILTVGIIIMLVTPYKGFLFAIISVAGIMVSIDVPYQLYKEKCRGVVEPMLIWGILVQNVVWLVYGIAIWKWPLIAFMVPCTVIAGVAAVFWHYYPQEKET